MCANALSARRLTPTTLELTIRRPNRIPPTRDFAVGAQRLRPTRFGERAVLGYQCALDCISETTRLDGKRFSGGGIVRDGRVAQAPNHRADDLCPFRSQGRQEGSGAAGVISGIRTIGLRRLRKRAYSRMSWA